MPATKTKVSTTRSTTKPTTRMGTKTTITPTTPTYPNRFQPGNRMGAKRATKTTTTTTPVVTRTTAQVTTMTTSTPVVITATPVPGSYQSPTKRLNRNGRKGIKNKSRVERVESAKTQMAIATMRLKLNGTEELSSMQLLNMWKTLVNTKSSKAYGFDTLAMKKQVAYRYMMMTRG